MSENAGNKTTLEILNDLEQIVASEWSRAISMRDKFYDKGDIESTKLWSGMAQAYRNVIEWIVLAKNA